MDNNAVTDLLVQYSKYRKKSDHDLDRIFLFFLQQNPSALLMNLQYGISEDQY